MRNLTTRTTAPTTKHHAKSTKTAIHQPYPLRHTTQQFLHLTRIQQTNTRETPIPTHGQTQHATRPQQRLQFQKKRLTTPRLLLRRTKKIHNHHQGPNLFNVNLSNNFKLSDIRTGPPLSISGPPTTANRNAPYNHVSFSEN